LLKDEQGQSILESKLLESVQVTPDNQVNVRLHLSKDYRKA